MTNPKPQRTYAENIRAWSGDQEAKQERVCAWTCQCGEQNTSGCKICCFCDAERIFSEAQPPAAPSTANEEEAVERMAIAMCKARAHPHWVDLSEVEREGYRIFARAALTVVTPTPDAVTALRERDEIFAEMLALLSEADRRIAWESLGLGNTFADRVEQVVARACATLQNESGTHRP